MGTATMARSPNVKMRMLPASYTYSKTFHYLFSTLCKTIKRTTTFYDELAVIRSKVKKVGIEKLVEVMEAENVLSKSAREYFDQMKGELPQVGTELASRALTYLLCLKDSEDDGSSGDVARA